MLVTSVVMTCIIAALSSFRRFLEVTSSKSEAAIRTHVPSCSFVYSLYLCLSLSVKVIFLFFVFRLMSFNSGAFDVSFSTPLMHIKSLSVTKFLFQK